MASKKDPNFHFYNTGSRPPTEEQLFALQEKYFKKRDPKVWSEMFEICHAYARSMVLKRNKGKSYLDPDIVEDKATGAALAFMTQYLNSKDFYVGGSFAGMIKWKVIEAMYKDYNEDNHRSFDEFLSESGTATLEDNQESAGFTNVLVNYDNFGVPEACLNDSQVTVITDVLDELEQALDMDVHSTLLVYFYMIICLRRPKNRHAKNMFLRQWADFKTNSIIDTVLLELRQRFKELYSN
jgi:hypothetical protein